MISVKWGAAIVMALAVTSPALADQPKPPAAAKAEAKAEKVGDKAKEGADKANKAADKAADKAEGKAKDGKDKAEEAKAEAPKADKEATKKKAKEDRDELKTKVQKALKGKAMHPSLKEELKRHARRLARLERIQAVATASKDDDTVDRVKKLIEKENDRHEKWMSKFDPEKGGGK